MRSLECACALRQVCMLPHAPGTGGSAMIVDRKCFVPSSEAHFTWEAQGNACLRQRTCCNLACGLLALTALCLQRLQPACVYSACIALSGSSLAYHEHCEVYTSVSIRLTWLSAMRAWCWATAMLAALAVCGCNSQPSWVFLCKCSCVHELG